jgi:hypothetical protein
MNEKNKKQIIIAAILGLVLAGVLVYQFVLREGPPPPSSSKVGVKAQEAATPAVRTPMQPQEKVPAPFKAMNIQEMIASVEVKPIDYPQERIARNPMTPLVGVMRIKESETGQEGVVSEALTQVNIDMTAAKVVSGIIWDKQYPVAIVDDMVVHVGYVFPNGAQVAQIEPTRVLFKMGDTIIPVEMKEY